VDPLPLSAAADAEADARNRRWESKQTDSRPLGSMERYRALNDAMDEAY
jgi:hypothetical protein